MAVRDPATEWVRVQTYRRMTPAERMEIAAQMYDDAIALVRSSILYRTPDIAPDDLEYEVRRRSSSGVPPRAGRLTEQMRRTRGRAERDATPAHGARLTLGLLAHGAGDPNSHRVWAGVASVAQERDVNLICFPGKPLRSPLEFEAQSNILYELVSVQSIDGLVIWTAGLPLFVDRPEMNAFCQRFRPLPMVTAGVPIEGIPGVTVDNYRGIHTVVSHLVEVHGRTRIAFVRARYHQEAEERYRAYLDVLSDYGISFDPGLVAYGNFKESGGAATASNSSADAGMDLTRWWPPATTWRSARCTCCRPTACTSPATSPSPA